MNNGYRLTGASVKSDGKTLTIKSDLAGVVGIPWAAVQTISSTPLNIALRDGGTVIGPVTKSSFLQLSESIGLLVNVRHSLKHGSTHLVSRIAK